MIYYDVKIGQNTLIGDGASIRELCTIGDECIIGRYVAINYNCHVGNRTKVMDLAVLTGNMTVGEDVFIAMNVSSANDNAMGADSYDEDQIAGPTIGARARIGVGAVLLPGVRCRPGGDGCRRSIGYSRCSRERHGHRHSGSAGSVE